MVSSLLARVVVVVVVMLMMKMMKSRMSCSFVSCGVVGRKSLLHDARAVCEAFATRPPNPVTQRASSAHPSSADRKPVPRSTDVASDIASLATRIFRSLVAMRCDAAWNAMMFLRQRGERRKGRWQVGVGGCLRTGFRQKRKVGAGRAFIAVRLPSTPSGSRPRPHWLRAPSAHQD